MFNYLLLLVIKNIQVKTLYLLAVWLIVLNCTLASIKTVASTHVVITMSAFIACLTAEKIDKLSLNHSR